MQKCLQKHECKSSLQPLLVSDCRPDFCIDFFCAQTKYFSLPSASLHSGNGWQYLYKHCEVMHHGLKKSYFFLSCSALICDLNIFLQCGGHLSTMFPGSALIFAFPEEKLLRFNLFLNGSMGYFCQIEMFHASQLMGEARSPLVIVCSTTWTQVFLGSLDKDIFVMSGKKNRNITGLSH